MKTLVGSTAMVQYIPGFREPCDVDYFTETAVKGLDTFYDPRLEQWDWGDIATLDELYTIKISHSFWQLRNGSWNKHMYDIQLMKSHGAEFIPNLYKILYPIWVDLHGKKKVSFDLEKEEFFNENVSRKYDHDSLHESIKYGDRPFFKEILKDDSEILSDEHKFNSLTDHDKLRLVHEELFVIALERFIIPNDYKFNPRVAYGRALRMMVTSMSKGWFPLWIVLNYSEVRKMPLDYVQIHLDNKKELVLL